MNRQKKAIADLAATIMGNVSVIGAGLALYEDKWSCLIIAFIAAGIAGIITWRANR